MSSKLTSTNPYLRDPAIRERMVTKSVATSTAVEGVHAPYKQASRGTTEKYVNQPPAPRKKR